MAGPDLDDELATLPDKGLPELRARWHALTGSPPPRVSAQLLRLALAWELQASLYGGLSHRAQQQLLALGGRKAAIPLVPGTRLVREWNGVLHTVIIGEDGAITWDGRRWNSLSQVARAITGTRWSGPAFFGLKARRKAA